LTTCWTQAGEAAAIGAMTCEARPAAIFGWACKIPSKIQITPNPTRSSRRPRASLELPPTPDPVALPPAVPRALLPAAPRALLPAVPRALLPAVPRALLPVAHRALLPVAQAACVAVPVPAPLLARPASATPLPPAAAASLVAPPLVFGFALGVVSRQVRAVAQSSQRNAMTIRAIAP
jgi:hypothetical protein